MQIKKTPVQIPKEFKALFDPQWRFIIFHGGRGSLKSHSVARALLLRGRASKLRILCTRELQKSIKDSVHKLLSDLIYQYEFDDYEILKDTITNKVTGTEFIFTGIRNNVNEIKSMEGIDICWVEEAHAITKASLDVLTPTIRKEGSQIIFTFNRVMELDPVYVQYCMNPLPQTFVAKVNYDIAEKLGWFPDVLKIEMEADKSNPGLFAHKWLGEPLAQVDDAIIGRDAVLNAMKREIPDDGAIEVGCDVARMGSDRTELVKRKGHKEIARETYQHLRTPKVCDRLEAFVNGDKQVLIKVDDTGVGGGVTDEMMKRGYNVMPINFGARPKDPDKYPNLISEAWFYMAEVIDQIQIMQDNDLLMELSSRKWVMDSKGRRGVESKDAYKKRGYRSPDKADATILCFYTPRPVKVEYAGPIF